MKESSLRKRLLLLIGSAVVFAVAVTAEQRIEQRVVERSALTNVKSMIQPAVTATPQDVTPEAIGPVDRNVIGGGGGLHHLCFETDDVVRELDAAREKGLELIDQAPRPAHSHWPSSR